MEEYLLSGIHDPLGIALDLTGGKVYWTNGRPRAKAIRRANLDGPVVETLIRLMDIPSGIVSSDYRIFRVDKRASPIARR